MSHEQLQGQNLSCLRGERLIFQGVNFKMSAGEALILKGRNGAGKSSLLRMVAGFIDPYQGSLALNGIEMSGDRDQFRQSVQYLGHKHGLKGDLSVAENLTFWARLHGNNDKAAVTDALQKLNISDLAVLPVRYLSSGQARRAALARLFLVEAPLWLLDEPTVGLDQESRENLATILQQHLAHGGMLMVATHQDLGIEAAMVNILDLDDFAPQFTGDVAGLEAML